ncbi:CPBP family intramembrane glutamic endopeptidase [Silanimonas sp.]|uniref:CPBP family intramembrane glutamic endopeptidase n=1 Tax=Silanimonas sp. TaxID=1929290 RepID=UPI001BBC39E0|nr:CPBP family intramembrane glutamic endopeptidase [Silanimonas sp.]MBS3896720.1 CPBP family intramembrane metalloprotease [Silanimonas sp.]MBS3924612.1 CPBP family intramembrane metalloprotease [Xanthomonadaceae bacterium]MBS3925008.1 CPBP family intramembrane metalloprotease [Xanthomonadaceae bacterium]
MHEGSSRHRRAAEVGGAIGTALVLSALIFVIGFIPILATDTFRVEAKFIAYPPSDATEFMGFEKEGTRFVCNTAAAVSGTNRKEISCTALDTDGWSGYHLDTAIEERGWSLVGNIQDTISAAAEAWAVLLAAGVYVLLGWAIVWRTASGWGVRELRELGFKAALLILPPILLAAVAAVLIANMSSLASVNGGAVGPELRMFQPSHESLLAVLPFLILMVLAAFPEEAIFRGWLHEKLFSQMPPWLAYVVVAEVFVLMHIGLVIAIFMGGESGEKGELAIVHVVVIFLLSLVFTWIRRVGGSVLLCALAHAAYNGLIAAAFVVTTTLA